MRTKICFLCVVLLHMQLLLAQEKQITGVVTASDDDLPMSGVAIIDKQSKNGTTTDLNGEFTLQISERTKSLNVSFLGYKSIDIPVSGTHLVVRMDPDVVAIDEVMVVAYGTGKKSTFTGSASVVKKETLEKIPTSNITQALQGQSSGVQVINSSGEPGDDAKILIRGIGSMNASSSPLYVVDGTAYDGYMNAINPSDIESITVLKDASATALYGSRAANGVVMITTKKGMSEKGQINFRATWGYAGLAVDLPRSLTTTEFTELTWLAMRNGRMDDARVSEAEAAQYATSNLANELKINPYNTTTPVGLDGKLDPNATLLYSGDWRNELLKSNLRQEYAIDFSGKNARADYFLSAGYTNDKGVFSIQKFERFSTRANLNYTVNNWLKVGTNINLTHGEREGYAGTGTVWFLRTISPTYPIYEWDYTTNTYKSDDAGNRIYDYGDNRQTWIGWNPLADAVYNPSPWMNDNVSNRTYVELTFLPGLTYRANISIDYYHYWSDGYVNSQYGFAAGYGGEVSKTSDRNFSYTINNLLTYNKTFGDHSVSVLAGQEAYSTKFKSLSASKRGLPFNGLTEINSASTMNSMSSYEDNYRLLSWLSRIEYDYKGLYYISGSFRTDGSSRFHPDSRWGNFWSLGTSWRMSNENFMKEYTWIDNLKIKASYGAVGNDGLNTYYAYQGLYSTGSNDYNYAGIRISRLANEKLKWESNMQLNIGIDFAFFNKLNGGIEWFNRKSKDLLFAMPMAPSTGFSSIDRNIGDVENTGIEFQLGYSAISTRDFKWTVDLNGTTYRNKITRLPQKEINSGYFKWREGESRYNFWGVEYAGVNPDTGNDQFVKNIYETKDGVKTLVGTELTEDINALTADDQKKYLGNAIPKFFGGVTNTFSYKGIDLTLMLYYSIGGKLYDSDYSQMMSYRTGYSMHPDMLKAWTPENKNASLPRLSTAYANTMGSYSSKFLFDNTFLRIRNLTLGYTLPKSLIERFQINKLRLFIQGDNFLTFGGAAGRGTDPEQDISGIAGNRFPTTKSISFGLQLGL